MNWEMIKLKESCIVAETDKAVLFKIPNQKEELLFWHSIKLVREFKDDNKYLTISFNEEFVFTVFMNGTVDNNFERLYEENFKANIFVEKFFKNDLVKKEIKEAPKAKKREKKTYEEDEDE